MAKNFSKNEIQQKIVELIKYKLECGLDQAEIDVNDSLFDNIGIDSISVLNLIILIEKEFSISFNEQDLNIDTFESINTISDLIIKKLKK